MNYVKEFNNSSRVERSPSQTTYTLKSYIKYKKLMVHEIWRLMN